MTTYRMVRPVSCDKCGWTQKFRIDGDPVRALSDTALDDAMTTAGWIEDHRGDHCPRCSEEHNDESAGEQA